VTTRVAYAGLLATTPAEWAALTAGLVVPETWFFRGGRALFDHLANELSERVRTRAATFPFVSSASRCQHGRGAVFTGNRAPRPASACQRFRIHAVDLAPSHLDRATAGRFSGYSFREAGPDPRPHSFRAVAPNVWELSPEIRESVQFRCADISARTLWPRNHPTI